MWHVLSKHASEATQHPHLCARVFPHWVGCASRSSGFKLRCLSGNNPPQRHHKNRWTLWLRFWFLRTSFVKEPPHVIRNSLRKKDEVLAAKGGGTMLYVSNGIKSHILLWRVFLAYATVVLALVSPRAMAPRSHSLTEIRDPAWS